MATDVDVVEKNEDSVQLVHANTEASLWIQLVVGGAICTVICLGFFFANKAYPHGLVKYMNGLLNERGPIQWLEMVCFCIVAVQIFLKMRIMKRQVSFIYDDPVQAASVNLNDENELLDLRKRILDGNYEAESIQLSRVEKAIGLWVSSHDVGRVSSWAGSEASRDASLSDLSYSLARTMVWAIPILGFIGTVQGLSSAVGGFTEFLKGAAELTAIKGAIADVTVGLGVAFDTTFLALSLVAVLQFPLSSVMRREEVLLGEVDMWLDEKFISRLPSPEQQPVVIENLEDSIEAAFRRYIPDPDRYEEVFEGSIERAGQLVATQLEMITEKYIAARREANETEIKELTAAMAEAHQRASHVAASYSTSVMDVQTAVQSSVQKANEAAALLSEQMAHIAGMGPRIEEMLQVEKAVDRTLSTLSTSESFQSTLEKLSTHLTATDEFCKKLSKPRVITLHEEVIS